ncbi:MAG: hypothetical protein ABS938_15540, partial [Psychrobacillus psychrodurans]
SFEDETETKSLVYTVEATDQYGDVFSNYIIEETINNDTYTHKVTANVDNVTETLDVQVYKYVLPVPPTLSSEEELKILKRRQDETENTVLFLLEMNLVGGM